MSIFKKKVISAIGIIVILFIVFTLVLGIIAGKLSFKIPNYSKMDRFLKDNFDELCYVADMLYEMDYEVVTIRNEPIRGENRYCMSVKREHLVYENISIPSNLINHIEALYEAGIRVISSGRDSVNISIWSNMDESRGIIYSRTGDKPNGEQLIEVRPLSKDNWYYYVHNYEKAKARNPDKFK